MVSCLPKSKHVKLTLACYPKSKSAAAKPNSSELQYLTYYAASRPKKLIKVGAFIKHKVIKDISWKRQNDVIVSLDICTALMEKCHQSLNLFVQDILDILQNVLRSNDTTVIEHTSTYFSAFCKHYDGSAFGTSGALTKSYEDILILYGSLAKSHSPLDVVGLQALYHACKSRALQSSHQALSSSVFVTTALDMLSSVKEQTLYQLRQSLQQRSDSTILDDPQRISELSRRSTGSRNPHGSEDIITQNLLSAYSLQILHTTLRTNDALRVRQVTMQILEFPRKDPDSSHEITPTLIQFAAEWVSIDLRFHVLAACLQELQSSGAQEVWATPFQYGIVEIVRLLLNSRISLIGLSFNDVLDVIFNIAQKVLQHSDNPGQMLTKIESESEEPRSGGIHFLRQLAAAVAALTTHTYYKGQTTDILRNILQRTTRFDAPIAIKRFQLSAAKMILLKSNLRRDVQNADSSIQLTALTCALCLLRDEPVLRKQYLDVFMTYLTIDCPESAAEDESTKRMAIEACRLLQGALFHYLCDSKMDFPSFLSGLHVIENLSRALPESQMISFVPMLHRVDQDCLNSPSYTSGGTTESCRMHLINLLHKIAVRSGLDIKELPPATAYDGRQPLPELHTILGTSSTAAFTDFGSLAYVTTSGMRRLYDPANNSSTVSRSSQRNRLVSEASINNQQNNRNDLAFTNSHQGQSDGGLIGTLKHTLLSASADPRVTMDRPSAKVTIEDLFAGIELVSLEPAKDLGAQALRLSDQRPERAALVSPSSIVSDSSRDVPGFSKLTNGERELGPAVA